MNIAKKVSEVKKLQEVNTPWEFFRIFGKINLHGTHISVGSEGDFAEIQDVQAAVSWLVAELGGTVKWSKNDKNS